MKAVFLAGGHGMRMSEEAVLEPKPMVEIGGKALFFYISIRQVIAVAPILWLSHGKCSGLDVGNQPQRRPPFGFQHMKILVMDAFRLLYSNIIDSYLREEGGEDIVNMLQRSSRV